MQRNLMKNVVAPLVGAWIEIFLGEYNYHFPQSLPSWERGLKSRKSRQKRATALVAPLVGAWIEIFRRG